VVVSAQKNVEFFFCVDFFLRAKSSTIQMYVHTWFRNHAVVLWLLIFTIYIINYIVLLYSLLSLYDFTGCVHIMHLIRTMVKINFHTEILLRKNCPKKILLRYVSYLANCCSHRRVHLMGYYTQYTTYFRIICIVCIILYKHRLYFIFIFTQICNLQYTQKVTVERY
jgi:hypothetical protein